MSTDEKLFPVTEIFGPVLQGEGAMIGRKTFFIRFAGCDFRCTMCDSLHSVLPELIKERAKRYTTEELLDEIQDLGALSNTITKWVTFSGGNPALHYLAELVRGLGILGKKIAVETQGTKFKDWMHDVNMVTISPKGPGMLEPRQSVSELAEFISHFTNSEALEKLNLKVVIFTEADLDYAVEVHNLYHMLPLYLSVGNSWPPNTPQAPSDHDTHVKALLSRMAWLEEILCKGYPELSSAIALPQLHVLMHSNEEGR